MSSSRTKNASRNIFFGMLNTITRLILPFITRTVIIHYLGMKYLGLGSFFSSLLQVLSITEAGIGGALVYKMYEPMAQGNDELVCALLAFYRKCYRIIGIIVMTIGIGTLPFLKYLIKSDIPSDVNIYVLYLINLSNTVIGYFLFAYKGSILAASQRNDVMSRVGIGLYIFQVIMQIIFVVVFKNYYLYMLVTPAMAILSNLFTSYVVDHMYPQYTCKGKLDKKVLYSLKQQVGGLIFQKIGTIILFNVDTIVISASLGLLILAKYNNYYYILTSLTGVLTVITSSIIPSVGNSLVTKEKKDLLCDLKKFTFCYVAICSWFASCYLSLVQPFIELWIGKENQFSMTTVILIAVYLYTLKMNDIVWVYREAGGLWWEGKFVPAVAAAVNLAFNLILVNMIGLPGIVISTIISMIVVYFPWGSYILFNCFFESKKEWKKYMLRHVGYMIGAVCSATITYMLCSRININLWLTLFFRGMVCLVVPNAVFFALFCKTESFDLAKQFTKGFVKKAYRKMRHSI